PPHGRRRGCGTSTAASTTGTTSGSRTLGAARRSSTIATTATSSDGDRAGWGPRRPAGASLVPMSSTSLSAETPFDTSGVGSARWTSRRPEQEDAMPRQQQAASGPQPQHQQPVAPPPIAPPPIPQYTTLSARTRRSRVNPLVQQVVTARAPGRSVRDTITAANGRARARGLEHPPGLPGARGAAAGVGVAGGGAGMGTQKGGTAFGPGPGAAGGGWPGWSAAGPPFSIPSLVALLGGP